mgnify:CR=1 FL=1
MTRLRVVSMSGGKDSTATLLLALETNWLDDVRAVFADTGNEHPATLDYVAYLSDRLGIPIETVRADFSRQMATKREKLLRIANGESESDVYGARKFQYPWSQEAAARAAELMQPTGNPFLDLCLLKGGFPSRSRLYCTEQLKHEPLEAWTYDLVAKGNAIESWQGVRADESKSRSKLPDYEWGPVFSTRRPILRWGVDRVFEQHRRHGIEPNPLYTLGCARVGCMPCINSGKDDLANMALRFPEHVEKVREYERLVGLAQRPMPFAPSFFHHSKADGHGIDVAVEWSQTSHGGQQFDWTRQAEPAMCSSQYGLCE